MEITINLITLTYHDGQFEVLLIHSKPKSYKIPTLKINDSTQNVYQKIKDYYQKTLHAAIKNDQIELLVAEPYEQGNQLPIVSLTQVSPAQYQTGITKLSKTLIWNNFEALPLQLAGKSLIEQGYAQLADQFRLQQLSGIKYILPAKFSATGISTLLYQLTGEPILYNNIKRLFASEIKVIGKDRSKKGRPVNILTYQTPKQ